ncbi:MAG: hypothetical protein LBJ86_00150 [Spirochaetaceae bacterium]|jgi:hypothetical protein|nr:hypothetical protein [Spirochaetaceae bacterium]
MERFKILLPVWLAAAVIISCEQGEGGLQGAWEDAGLGEEYEGAPLMTGISIASPPETIYYARGQEFDPGGLVVEGEFEDGSSRALDEGEYRLAVIPPDMSVSGPKEVEVTAGEFTAVTAVIVNNSDSVLDSISVSAAADNVCWLGESFRPAALNVAGIFKDNAGNTEKKNLSAFSVQGYDRDTRGEQIVTVSVNGKKGAAPVRVAVPADAELVTAWTEGSSAESRLMTDGTYNVWGHNTAFIKNQSLALSNVKFRIQLNTSGGKYTLLSGNGINPEDIDLDTSKAGLRTAVLNLDDKKINMNVYVADAGPEAYFDYGFWRHEDMTQPDGYHTVPNNKVVLSPVRVLIGYDRDNRDIGAAYEWTVTSNNNETADISYSANKEFLSLTPKTTGTWNVTVKVKGRNFIDGNEIEKTAVTKVVCDERKTMNYAGNSKEYKHFAPGQFTEGGTGAGWSLGVIGGYWIKSRPHYNGYAINGNAFGSWTEPGMVWFQEDLNGNNEPDEVWYEAHGAPSAANAPITRRYSVAFFKADDTSTPSGNSYGQILRGVYWADCKGRTGKISGGWPYKFGAPNYDGAKVTFTCTLFSDDDRINISNVVNSFSLPANVPFVDHGPPAENFYISSAVAADGSPVTLTNVRFVKVHTAVFKYGDTAFGEISTEVDQYKGSWAGDY